MIATHNIKVNGRWIPAGTEYGEEKKTAPKKVKEPVSEPEVAEIAPADEEAKEAKAKSTSRRKVSK